LKYSCGIKEIYQIAFDSDEHIRENAAINIPWIAVRDPQSVYSPLIGRYNVRNLSMALIIYSEGDICSPHRRLFQIGKRIE